MAVRFEWDYTLNLAVMIPREVVVEHADFDPHQNGHLFHLRQSICDELGVIDITTRCQNVIDTMA